MTRLATLVFALVLVAVPAGAIAGIIDSDATLKGLAGVDVVVENFVADARRAGFSEERFKTTAELKLRLAGDQGAHAFLYRQGGQVSPLR